MTQQSSRSDWRRIVATIGLLGGPLAGIGQAAYTVVSLADGRGATLERPTHVGINNAGTVVSEWTKDDGNGIVLTLGPTARTIADGNSGGNTTGYFGVAFSSINNVGQVAFIGSPYTSPSTVQVQLQRDTAGAKTTVTAFGNTNLPGNATSINDSGVIAYRSTLNNVTGIRRSDGTTAASVGTDGFQTMLDPSINNGGTVAFKGKRNNAFGLYRVTGTTASTIVDDSGPVSDVFSAEPSINTAGNVAFSATLDDNSGVLYDTNGGALRTLVTTAGEFDTLSWSSLNNTGQVAFTAIRDGETGGGVYVVPELGGAVTRVIGPGDALNGSTVTDALINSDAINDAGQITFIYRLADGTRGVGLATVPEPAGLAVLAAVVVPALGRRRRSR